MAKKRKKEVAAPEKKKKLKEVPTRSESSSKSKWQDFISKHAVSKQQ